MNFERLVYIDPIVEDLTFCASSLSLTLSISLLLKDYEASESETVSTFECLCGSPRCRRQLRGFKASEDIIRKQYGKYIASFLNEMPPEKKEQGKK